MEANTTDGTNTNITETGPIHIGDLPNSTYVQDPWKHRSKGMRCETCMFYVNTRCRRHAPTLQGYPAVYPDDWCGDHKLDKVCMGGV